MATPNVKLDGGVFSSLRMMHLGSLLGTSVFDAVGRMALLWQTCTERQTSVLSEAQMRAVIDPDLVVEADLGERIPGGVRLKGTAGRIEWYGKVRDSGKKGAAKRWNGKPNGVAIASPQPGDSQPVEEGEEREDVVGLSLSPGKRGPGGKGRRAPAKKPDVPMPDGWAPTDKHREYAAKHGLDLEREALAFRAHAETYDRRAASWNGAFSTWLLKGDERARDKARASPSAPTAADLWAEADRLEAEGR